MNGPSPSSTSTQLLERARTGDNEAWRAMTNLYGPLAYRWARQMGLKAADAADVTQDVFVSLFRNLSGFRKSQEGDSFRAWLRVVVRNQVHLWRRKRTVDIPAGGSDAASRLEQLAESELSSSDLPPERGERANRALQRIRGDFEAPTWTCFLRLVIENQTVADVARELSMTTAAVRQAKYRVLCRLREELETESPPTQSDD